MSSLFVFKGDKVGSLAQVSNALDQFKTDFDKLASKIGIVNFESEKLFAIQHLKKKGNEKLLEIALNKKDDFKLAILNIAHVGLSLCPSKKEAYLIPRDGSICVDFSYIGLCKLAQDDTIEWVQADPVYENDTFEIGRIDEAPTHKYNVFSDRGKIVGFFCTAKTYTGSYLTDFMSVEQVNKIRDNSQAYIAWKTGKVPKWKIPIWELHYTEMGKKTVVRRAYKMWPKTNERLAKAIHILNEQEQVKTVDNLCDKDQAESITSLLTALNMPHDDFLKRYSRIIGREFTFEDLTFDEANRCITSLRDILKKDQDEIDLVEF